MAYQLKCQHPGCVERFNTVVRAGRPALYCPEHRRAKYGMWRTRNPDKLTGRRPPCCQEAGRQCPQHRAMLKIGRRYIRLNSNANPRLADARRETQDLIDTIGHAAFLSDTGYPLGGWLPRNEDTDY